MGLFKYKIEITIFVCGAVVMIFELVGSRILGPFFGTSIFVWTSLIGIVLGSLSLGYYLGGKLSDNNPRTKILSEIVFLAAFSIALSFIIKDRYLIFLQNILPDIRSSSLIASLTIFSPASVLLGMVSPYAAKLKLDKLDYSGTTIGKLYAISTTGSIFGTFLSGFFLVPYFGTDKTLIIISIALFVTSSLLYTKHYARTRLFAALFLIVSCLAYSKYHFLTKGGRIIDVDTAYNRVWVYDSVDRKTNRKIKTMKINNENSSSMFLDSNELVYDYTKYYRLAEHFNPNFQKCLMIGGAGYSFPKYFLQAYPLADIDVIEIDPGVTALAKKYFRLEDSPRLMIYHDDARNFLNKTTNKYDIIFGDAFNSQYSLPFQLTTKEAVQKQFDILNKDGLVILNIIASIDGSKGQFLRAEQATYKDVFPTVFLFQVQDSINGEKAQNLILIAIKSSKEQSFFDTDPELDMLLQNIWKKEIKLDKPILTDDYAPVEYYADKTL